MAIALIAPPKPPQLPGSTPEDGQITLNWEGVAARTYKIKRSTTSGGPYTEVGEVSGISFVDITVTNAVTYYYVITSVSDAGEGSESAEIVATPTAGASPPDAPTGVVATPGDGSITLSWDASVGATGYRIYLSLTTGGPYTLHATSLTVSYTDTGLTNGTRYYYVVSAVNDNGEGPLSAEVSAVPAVPTPPPDVVYDREFYASPTGTPTGTGLVDDPLDLATALSGTKGFVGGDVIWLRAGTYVGDFDSNVSGTPNSYVTFRTFPGEVATIDGSLLIDHGFEWTTWWGVHITTTALERTTTEIGSIPPGGDRGGVTCHGANNRFINMVVYDSTAGWGFWGDPNNVESEMYGNIIFNNGWEGPDRTHGHGIYTQNDVGLKFYRENIVFNNFGRGIQNFRTADIPMKGFRFENNILFNDKLKTLFGGSFDVPISDITLEGNYFYRDEPTFGFRDQGNQDVLIKDNYFAVKTGSDACIFIKWWAAATVTGNKFYDIDLTAVYLSMTHPIGGSVSDHFFDNNTYVGNRGFYIRENDGTSTGYPTLSDWQTAFGQDLNSVNVPEPTTPEVFVRPNAHESGRANIVIYNWPLSNSVDVDVSSVLNVGDSYELRNVQDYFGDVITGTYAGGNLSVSMIGRTAAIPRGYTELIEPNTFPQFGVFLLVRTS